jgi:3-deoxy-D-manno-octulosonic acid kinase
MSQEISPQLWKDIATTIKKFHDAGLFHADLNANNIMISTNNEVYLIDFDKSEFRVGNKNNWKENNIKRLLRSLNKIKNNSQTFNFGNKDWELFLTAYQ